MTKEKVRQLAAEFRGMLTVAIESGLDTHCSLGKEFPAGCCDDSSLLLAAFLTDNGHPGSLRIHGIHGGLKEELETHVWLSLDGLLIDITGSQFNEDGYSQAEVLVAEKCDFLSTFTIEEELEIADFREKFSGQSESDRRMLSYFSTTYSKLMKYRELGRLG